MVLMNVSQEVRMIFLKCRLTGVDVSLGKAIADGILYIILEQSSACLSNRSLGDAGQRAQHRKCLKSNRRSFDSVPLMRDFAQDDNGRS